MKKIPVYEPFIGSEELNNVLDAIKFGWIGSAGGKYLKEFEEEFAKYHGIKHAVPTSSGTAALHVTLKALGIKRGDEVIVPDLTFVATANVVTYCNAKPIFIDVHPEYWCIDPRKIEEKITKNTKAIIVVHLYGHPCYMNAIIDVAKEHDLYVIEDVAQAHGAEYKGKKVGTFGDVACFSFYGNKVITTGEGGICLTNNDELSEKIKLFINHGKSPLKHFWHEVIGFNYRMTNLQAAIGVAQLRKLDNFIKKKRQITRWYKEELKDLAEDDLITLQPEMDWAKCIYWMFSVLIEDSFVISRDDLMKKLEGKGIETRPFFYPMHILPIYKSNERFPISEELARKGINLPSSLSLKKKDIKYVCESIKVERK